MAEIKPNKEAPIGPEKLEIRPEVEEIIKPEIKPEIEEKEKPPISAKEKAEVPSGRPYVHIPFKKGKKEEPLLEKSETIQEIESILSENLEPYYQNLPEAVKEQFKKKGEETAVKIEKIISQTKIAVKKILNLIVNWLKIIPGISRFFLEQESKIKTDKILKLAERKRKQRLNL